MKPGPRPASERGIGRVLEEAAERLLQARAPLPERTAQDLAARLLGLLPLDLLLQRDESFPALLLPRFDRLVERAAAHEPPAYLLGHAAFLDLDLSVDRRALIPRPETEGLAERVLACDAIWRPERGRLADVGTGCGCLALAFARGRPRARIWGVDRSRAALALARLNARRLGLQDTVAWRYNDLLQGWPPASLDAVTANLPYLPEEALRTLPASVRFYEPMEALDGGADGLRLIARLLPQAFAALASDGRLFLEIHPGQGGPLRPMLEQIGFVEPRAELDLAGRERYTMARKP